MSLRKNSKADIELTSKNTWVICRKNVLVIGVMNYYNCSCLEYCTWSSLFCPDLLLYFTLCSVLTEQLIPWIVCTLSPNLFICCNFGLQCCLLDMSTKFLLRSQFSHLLLYQTFSYSLSYMSNKISFLCVMSFCAHSYMFILLWISD